MKDQGQHGLTIRQVSKVWPAGVQTGSALPDASLSFLNKVGFVNVGNPNGLWIVFTYYLNLDIQLNGGLFIMIHGRSYEPG